MPKTQYTKTALKEAIAGKLQRHFACEVEDATKDQVYEACALVVRDALTEHMIETQNEVERDGERQVHYLCMEFLVGRSLRNNAYNLGMLDALTASGPRLCRQRQSQRPAGMPQFPTPACR